MTSINVVLMHLVFAFIVVSAPISSAEDVRVKIANGELEGIVDPSTGIGSFKGIPFAAPPVGDLRWREPQPVKNWQGVRKADKFGPRAIQPPIFDDMVFRSNGMGEDCLYLNVWIPAKSVKERLPVLVYFYGGGFVAGDGSEARYDGESMARLGIVAVTVNYRLNVFGFLSHPELTKESPHHASGNYGLLDQSAALQWVHKNIAAFGGDPKRVTIAGESAGSLSVSAQMASPLSKGLIAGAIGESGALINPTLPAIPQAEGEQIGLKFMAEAGAKSLSELRAMAAEKILDAAMKSNPFRFLSTIDGYFLPKPIVDTFESGQQARVPLLVGWNADEVGYKFLMGEDKLTPANFAKKVRDLYSDKADEVLKLFPAGDENQTEQSAIDLASDRFIVYSTWKWADMHARTSGQRVYRYIFERPRPGEDRAHHAIEIEYALGNLDSNKVYKWTEEDHKVSRTMQSYFADFVKTGNPNGKDLPEWPSASNGSTVQVMHLNVISAVKPEQNRERYLFLDKEYSKR